MRDLPYTGPTGGRSGKHAGALQQAKAGQCSGASSVTSLPTRPNPYHTLRLAPKAIDDSRAAAVSDLEGIKIGARAPRMQ